MFDWLSWFTDLGNSKIAALLIFFTTYVAILIWVFTGKKRKERLESYKYIPFDDDNDEQSDKTGRGTKANG